GGRPAPRLPHGVPTRRATGHRVRRRRERRGRALPEPVVGPTVHPQPRRQRRRRAAVGAGPLPVIAGPLPVTAGPLPVTAGPLPVTAGPLPVIAGPASDRASNPPL